MQIERRQEFGIACPISPALPKPPPVRGSLLSPDPLNLSIPVTADEVIVHHADRLHVRIDHRRTDEAESAVLEILAERVGFA